MLKSQVTINQGSAAFVVALWLTVITAQADEAMPPPVSSVVNNTCAECHDSDVAKGEFDIFTVPWTLGESSARAKWIRIFDRVAGGEMPPDAKDLDDGGRKAFMASLRAKLLQADRADIVANGRAPLRRLTAAEYESNLRDILHLPRLDIAGRLPEDRQSHGFTKVSSILDMSRIQLAGYLDAADAALRTAIAPGLKPAEQRTMRAVGTRLFPDRKTFGGVEAMFFTRGNRMLTGADFSKESNKDESIELALFRSATWPYFGYPMGLRAHRDGEYRVRFAGRSVRQVPGLRIVPGHDPLPMTFRTRRPTGPDITGEISETGGWIDLQPEEQEFKTTVLLKAGEAIEYSLLGLPVPFIRTEDKKFYYDYPPIPPEGHRGAAFRWIEMTGPIQPKEWPPVSHRVLFDDLPLIRAPKGSTLPIGVQLPQDSDVKEVARRLLHRFVNQARKGAVTDESLQVYHSLVAAKLDAGMPFEDAMIEGYQAFLCSGYFIYLKEPQFSGQYGVAARLSHLLWNSGPDKKLLDAAQSGQLHGRNLQDMTERMIQDPKFKRFIAEFSNQWLQLDNVWRDIPDPRLYPEYRKDDYLTASMEMETLAMVGEMFSQNLPSSVLVDSDFIFVNDRLAAHYDLPRQQGSTMRRVTLPQWSPYGGIMTQAAIMKLTANGTTTSPVHRGVWVMEKILGDPPPPPPKTVPSIKPDVRGATTIRQQLAKHTKSKSCAACHARFDPVGFALENFDVMGAWRDRYRGLKQGQLITGTDPAGHPFEYRIGAPVDAAGKLPNGDEFKDVLELKKILLGQPFQRQVARNLLTHLTLYATGTPVRFADRPEIERILDACMAEGYRSKDLFHGLIQSPIFLGYK